MKKIPIPIESFVTIQFSIRSEKKLCITIWSYVPNILLTSNFKHRYQIISTPFFQQKISQYLIKTDQLRIEDVVSSFILFKKMTEIF